MDYGVGVKNKFELFDLDVEDPDFIHIKTKKQSQKSSTAGAETKKPLQKSNVIEKNKTVVIKSTPAAAVSSSKAASIQKTNDVAAKVRSNDNRDSNRRTDKTGGRFPDKKGDRKSDRPGGKREFDRRSGSDKAGVKPTEKREGFGKNNWGNYSEDAETTQNETTDAANHEDDLDHTNEEIENVEPVGEEPKVLTLEEYRKQEQEKRLVPKFNIRKPGEGDTQQWKKGYVLKKEEEEEEHVVVYEEIEVEETKQGKHKKVLEIDIAFREERRNFRGDRRENRPFREGGDRRPYGDRDRGDRDRGDRRPYGDRGGDRGEGGERSERRPYGDRGGDRGDRPDRPRRDRDGENRERRPDRFKEKRERREQNDGEDGEKDGEARPFDRSQRKERRERPNKDGEERTGEGGEQQGYSRSDRRDREHDRDRGDRPQYADRGDRGDRPPRGERKDRRSDGERADRRDGDRRDGDRRDGDRRDGDRSFRGDGPRKPSGPYRGKGGKQAAPKFDDLNDFPNLGLGA